jgi:hypothetical protein
MVNHQLGIEYSPSMEDFTIENSWFISWDCLKHGQKPKIHGLNHHSLY